MLRLYNSLTRKIEDFKPIDPPRVGIYACGPTVYDFAHIGNFRTYTTSDLLVRVLKFNKYEVKYVMNLTDVGHLTGDNAGDADTGEDRMEKSAKKEGKTAWEVAEFYTKAFLKDYEQLNLTQPLLFAKATNHIQEQIDLVKRLEEKGYTYKTSDGIYFDTSAFPQYGKLSTLDEIKQGARIEPNPEKKNPRDFALWKFSKLGEKRHMEWSSPWGRGFPGWHIECSAMSMKYLGESFDVHAGGIDLRSTHHPNEIAQSEAATGQPFVKYWVHGAFVLVDGKRMSKSLGSNYKVKDVIDNGFNPLVLRYLYLQTHYRQEMNFTWEALTAAQNALNHLYIVISEWDKPKIGCAAYEQQFLDAINDDLNLPKALSIAWDVVKSDYPTSAKAESLFKFDQILGLRLQEHQKARDLPAGRQVKNQEKVPSDILHLVRQREKLRKQKEFNQADILRKKIQDIGYVVRDNEDGTTTIKKK